MNSRIRYLLNHPFEAGADDVPALQDEIDRYPYFPTLRLLMLFGLKEHDHPSFQEELKLAAIQSPSRVALYHYLQKERKVAAEEEKTEVAPDETLEIDRPLSETEESEAVEKSSEAKEYTAEQAPLSPTEDEVETEVELKSETPESAQEETEDENVETHEFTFSEWLNRAPAETPKEEAVPREEALPSEKEIKYKLIDEFIEKAPKITTVSKDSIPDPAKARPEMTPEYSDLMTETLAQIYLEQKKYDKAIRAYKILGLKYPDKGPVFSEKIREIENMRDAR